MSPPRVHTGKPASTSMSIIDAARDVFLKEGFEAASMDAIARHADVSKATLYAHFDGKEILFTAMMKAQRDQYERQLDDLEADAGGDFAERLTRVGTALLTFLLTPSKLQMFRVMIAESERIPEICLTFLKTSREHSYQRIARLFRDGIASGQLIEHDVDEAARQFVAVLRGDLVWTSLLSGPQHHPTPEEIAARISAVVQPLVKLYARRDPDNLNR